MKIDLHVHTKEVSICGHMPAEEVAAMYKAAGYDCIVITNHFNTHTLTHFEEQGVVDFFKHYHDSYLLAEEAGRKAGLLVLNGYEIRFDGADSDYLVYGMSDGTAKDCKKLFSMKPRDFSALAAEQGFLFYQAHPFRNNMKITDPALLTGIEIKNGNPRHDSRNDVAEIWAKKFGMRMIAGSDAHRPEDVGVTGIITDENVTDTDSLISMLKNNNYRII